MAESANFSAGAGSARPTSQNAAITSPGPAGEHRSSGGGASLAPSAPKGHLIASATQKVLIHKLDDSVPTALINEPHEGFEVSALTWSHNNMILATCGANSSSITLARTSDGNVIQ